MGKIGLYSLDRDMIFLLLCNHHSADRLHCSLVNPCGNSKILRTNFSNKVHEGVDSQTAVIILCPLSKVAVNSSVDP